MKKVLFGFVALMVVVLVVGFTSKESAIKKQVASTAVAVNEVTAQPNTDIIKLKADPVQIDFSGFKFEETEEIIKSSSTSSVVTEDKYPAQKIVKPIWNRNSTEINTGELALAREGINKLIYDINLAIELDGSFQPPGGRKLMGGDMMVTAQICAFENNLFNLDHEFETLSAQHYCLDIFSNLMSSLTEYRDTKKTLKKIEQEMLVILASY